MNVLIINGSPKGEASDTMHVTRAFVHGIKSYCDATVETLTVRDSHIEYCTGCLSCMRNGGKCVLDDDMADILRRMLSSDVVIFSTPLYTYSFPAKLKNLIDRTISLSAMAMSSDGVGYSHTLQADVSRMHFVLICGCGFPNAKRNFEPAVMQFNMTFRRGNTVITVPEAPMFSASEAKSVTEPRLEVARQAGREYAENGSVSADTLSLLTSPMIPEAVYADICSGKR